MKKFILSSVFALALIPALSVANPLEALTRVSAPGTCETSDANFCSCFYASAVHYCKLHQPAGLCTMHNITTNIRHVTNVSGFCTKYRNMFPPNADHASCVTAVSYAQANC